MGIDGGMGGRASSHLRSNAIGYLALFVALTGTTYAANKVTSKEIKRGAVKSKHIRDGKVGNPDLADDAVTGIKVEGGSLRGSDIATGSISGADIQNETIGSADVASNSLRSEDVENHSLTGNDIQDGTVTGADAFDNSFTGADVQNGSLSGDDVGPNPTFNGVMHADQIQTPLNPQFGLVPEVGIENSNGILKGYLTAGNQLAPRAAVTSPLVASNVLAALRPPPPAPEQGTTSVGLFLHRTLIADQNMLNDELAGGGGFVYVRRPTETGPLQLAVKWPDGEIDILAQDD